MEVATRRNCCSAATSWLIRSADAIEASRQADEEKQRTRGRYGGVPAPQS
jgi:hypothetical protein